MKKALNVAKTVVTWAIVVFAVCMMVFTIVSVNTFDRSDRSIFGYKAYIVQTDSMSATDFSAGDLIFVKHVDPTTLQEGDIITFFSQNTDSFGETVTHKIRRATVDAEGNPGFVTYGTTTNTDDEAIVSHHFIIGKYQGKLKGVGTFFTFLKSPQGYFLCIFIPFMLLIISQGVNCIHLFRHYKAEQMAQLKAEKDALEEERAENARILKELQEMRARMEAEASSSGAKSTEEEPETPVENSESL